jgi:hypothetical protein
MMMTAPDVQYASLAESLDRVYKAITRNIDDSTMSGAEAPGWGAGPCFALERLENAFQLTAFERDTLILCAGTNLESRFAKACAALHDDPHATWPTFGLALALLEGAHWSAISRERPLRYWKLIESAPNHALLKAPLRLDERILQFLIDVPTSDERLEPYFHLIPQSGNERLRQQSAIQHAIHYWEQPRPVLLTGSHASTLQSAFVEMCHVAGLRPYLFDAAVLSSSPADCDALARLWTREAVLTGAALYIRNESLENTRSLKAFLDLLRTPVAVEATQGSAAEHLEGPRVYIAPLDASERKTVWAQSLGPLTAQMNGHLDRLAEYFQFDEDSIRSVAAQARNSDGSQPAHATWHICREHARRSLDLLAGRIPPRATWDDLVLPPSQMETLHQLTAHVRQRAVVHEAWGFADKHARGLGLSVLFAGASGTGKTMAAEILAGELALDLYQIDLSAVVSKYIGETEKNLRRIFTAAEQSGAVLLFDEADALFGKRSEVRDSHDRYANLEISYLLQQMEAYRGIAILTTNMQNALDPAFLRRIRFIVQFPFPDAAARRQIWERIFPTATPVGTLNFDHLAQLNVSGGVIRNIAIHAAFLAAEDNSPVEMLHLLSAARTEYQKIEKPLTTAETRGWS